MAELDISPPPSVLAELRLPEAPICLRAAGVADQAAVASLREASFKGCVVGPKLDLLRRAGLPDGEDRVLLRGDRVISCLRLAPLRLSFAGVSVPVGGVSQVCTETAERNHGHASRLLRDSLRLMRQRRQPLSLLFPYSFRYYNQFGYEMCGSQTQVWTRPESLPTYRERRHCRPATEDDLPRLRQLYDAFGRRHACWMERSEAEWRALLQTPGLDWRILDTPEGAGYFAAQEERDSYDGRVLNVLELVALSPLAWRACQGWLASRRVDSIEWLAAATEVERSGMLRCPTPLQGEFRPRAIATVRPMFQVRVTDAVEAVRARLPVMPPPESPVTWRIRDEVLPENNATVTLVRRQGRSALVKRPARASISTDVRTFARIYCGFVTPSEAESQGALQASSLECLAAADRMFPFLDPFISSLDRF